MKLSDEEKRTIEYQFDSFCKKVLREESRSIKRKIQREKILSSNAITNLNKEDLFVYEKYPSDFHQFNVDQYLIEIADDQLARALKTLSGKKRNIVLLAYFLDMTDQEIAANLDTSRALVQKQRKKSLNTIKQKMEKKNGKNLNCQVKCNTLEK